MSSSLQLKLDLRAKRRVKPKRTFFHGGKRDGAGRKQVLPGRPRVKHRKRQETKARFPVLVTKRLLGDVANLRNYDLAPVLRRAFVYGCTFGKFRICQFSIMGNHIHLICEAENNAALAEGIKAWSVRVTKAINGYCKARGQKREGSVFEDRYDMRIIKTPRDCRARLLYVMQNARRHGLRIDSTMNGVDPFSSAWWFDGWKDNGWREGLRPPQERSVAVAETWLLKVGWRQYGLIGVFEVPPAANKKAKRRGDTRAQRDA